ncbi:hypothetical protein [Paenibacillus sp. NPDC055715]
MLLLLEFDFALHFIPSILDLSKEHFLEVCLPHGWHPQKEKNAFNPKEPAAAGSLLPSSIPPTHGLGTMMERSGIMVLPLQEGLMNSAAQRSGS